MWELHSLSKYLLKKETDLENDIMVARGKGIVKEIGVIMCTLLYLKWITNKDLLYSTGKSAQCHVAAYKGGGFGENGCMCMFGWVSSVFTWNYHKIVNRLYPNKKLKVQKINTCWRPTMQEQQSQNEGEASKALSLSTKCKGAPKQPSR